MRALRGLNATSMGRTKESQMTEPFLLRFRDGQYEPELCRIRLEVRHWMKVADTLDIHPQSWESCYSLPKRRGPIQLLNTILFATGVRTPKHLDWEIDGRRWRPCRGHGVEQVALRARKGLLWARLAQAGANYGGLKRRPLWRKSVGEVDRHLADQVIAESINTPAHAHHKWGTPPWCP